MERPGYYFVFNRVLVHGIFLDKCEACNYKIMEVLRNGSLN